MKNNFENIIISILLIIFCTTRFWGINLPWYINLIVRLVLIIFLIITNNFKYQVNKKVSKIMKITIAPIILIVLYSILLWGFENGFPKPAVIRNLFTTNIYLIIDVIFGALFYMIYKEKSIDMFVNCGFFSYIIGSIIPLIIKYPGDSLIYLITSHSTNYSLLYLTEINDLTFAIGFCLLYYLFFSKNKNKKNIIKCFLMIFWGLKRIELFALLLCYIFYKFIVTKFNIKKTTLIATFIILFVSYIYILFIHNSNLIQLASKYNINFMGRLTTYTYVTQNYSEFSPSYLGIGFGYIDEILNDLVASNFKIGFIPIISLHSDILRMYIGLGFVGFGIWITYQCLIKTKILAKKVDVTCAKAYLVFTIYLFVLYLTDNTYSYPITFTVYFISTLCCITEKKEKE